MVKLWIPRNGDSLLSILGQQVGKYYHKEVRQNPYNPFTITPKVVFVGLTALDMLSASVLANNGAITDDTLTNQQSDRMILAEVRVGTETGTGIGYSSDLLPLKNEKLALEAILEIRLKEAFSNSSENYHHLIGESAFQDDARLCSLADVQSVNFLAEMKEHRCPYRYLRKLAQDCSKILSSAGDEGIMGIEVHNETRRYVNSGESIIRDTFYGYHLYFTVKAYDAQRRPMEFVRSLNFTEEKKLRKAKKAIERFAERMKREIQLRKDCPVIETGIYDVFNTAEAMSSELHEALVHFSASDKILDGSTAFGWENWGKLVANPCLDVYTDPGLTTSSGALRWGSMKFDYEGVPALKRQLINKGILVGYLADRHGAYHLSRLTQAEILPGDARFGMLIDGTFLLPQPRISNLDVYYAHPKQPKTQKGMMRLFLKELNRKNKRGIFVLDGGDAASDTESGEIEHLPYFPYIVEPNGQFIPTKFITTRSSSRELLNNIVMMGEPRKYFPHYCAGEEMAKVRAGITCGPALVRDVYISTSRKPKLRQR